MLRKYWHVCLSLCWFTRYETNKTVLDSKVYLLGRSSRIITYLRQFSVFLMIKIPGTKWKVYRCKWSISWSTDCWWIVLDINQWKFWLLNKIALRIYMSGTELQRIDLQVTLTDNLMKNVKYVCVKTKVDDSVIQL